MDFATRICHRMRTNTIVTHPLSFAAMNISLYVPLSFDVAPSNLSSLVDDATAAGDGGVGDGAAGMGCETTPCCSLNSFSIS